MNSSEETDRSARYAKRHPSVDKFSRTAQIDANDFAGYQIDIVHDWLRTVTGLVIVLVPVFFVLDVFIAPNELLARFAIYRAVSTAIALAQYVIVRNTQPSRFSILHGYLVSLQVGGFIALMTSHLGGFASGYYPGLIMVIIGVNLLMPWRAAHTAANSLIIVTMYVVLNIDEFDPARIPTAANNLFFLIGTAVIAVAITHVRYRLIEIEFSLLVQLKQARDALWGEMELAKQVQVALLPGSRSVRGFDIDVSYAPAKEVGGDYYDIIETKNGARYVIVGDVSGHGLDSGLIMMMAQTSVTAVLNGHDNCSPAKVLKITNAVLRENIGRLNSQHYMTMTVIKLEEDRLVAAGHHQDLLIYHGRDQRVETVSVHGTWLGIADDIDGYVDSVEIRIEDEDTVLLYTDGITEATSDEGVMYGEERLGDALKRYANLNVRAALHAIVSEVEEFQDSQDDDMTLIMLRRERERREGTGEGPN